MAEATKYDAELRIELTPAMAKELGLDGKTEAWVKVGEASATTRPAALETALGDPAKVKPGKYRLISSRYIGEPQAIEPETTVTLKITPTTAAPPPKKATVPATGTPPPAPPA